MAALIQTDHTRPMQFHVAEVYWGWVGVDRDKGRKERKKGQRSGRVYLLFRLTGKGGKWTLGM